MAGWRDVQRVVRRMAKRTEKLEGDTTERPDLAPLVELPDNGRGGNPGGARVAIFDLDQRQVERLQEEIQRIWGNN